MKLFYKAFKSRNEKRSLSIAVLMAMVIVLTLSVQDINAAGSSTVIEDDPHLVDIVDVSKQYFNENNGYELEITVRNNDVTNWRDMYFKLDFGSAPIYVTDANDGQFLDDFLVGQEYVLIYHIYTDDDSAGIYNASLVVSGTSYILEEMDVTKSLVFEVKELSSEVNWTATVIEDTMSTESSKTLQVQLSHDDFVNSVSATLESDSSLLAIEGPDTIDGIIFSDKTVLLEYRVKSSEQSSQGFIEMNLKVSYSMKEYMGQILEIDLPIYVSILEDTASSQAVEVEAISVSDSYLNVGNQSVVKTAIINVSDHVIEELVITLDYDQAVVPVTQDTIIIHGLEAGESRNVYFTVEATDEADTRNYPLGIMVDYEGLQTKQYTGVYVYNDDEEDEEETLSKPKMMITGYDIDQDRVYAGDTFELLIDVINTHGEQVIQNVKITVSESGSTTRVFIPVGTGSSSYIDTLEPKESSVIDFNYQVLDQAEGQVYSLTVAFDYEDNEGNTYTDSETISIPVYQESVLTISDVSFGNTLDTGFTLEADFYNTGKIDIDNLMVDIEVDGFSTNNSNYYVGTFEAGRTDVYDVEISGTRPDGISGRLIFTYDDTFGASQEVVKEFGIGTLSQVSGGSDTASTGPGGNLSASTESGAGAGAGNRQASMELPEGMSREEFRQALQNGEIDPNNMAVGELQGAEGVMGLPLEYLGIGVGVVLVVILIVVLQIRKRKKVI